MADGWTPVLSGIHAPGNTFVLPRQKILYVSVTKVACTSLRWMVADLAGEDFARFYAGIAAHETRLMTVHLKRKYWQQAVQLFRIPRDERAAISRDNGWFVFAVVRDPWTRLWSAWQSKFLVRHPYYVAKYADEPWFPRVPTSPHGVIEDFRAFVFAEPWVHNERLRDDVHFKTQVHSVKPGHIDYTEIYDLSRLPDLFADIHTHLAGLGLDQELYLPRANETPLPIVPAVLADGVAEQIEKSYREDFDAFGDRWSLDALTYKTDTWSADALEHAAYHGAANERIGDLSAEALRLRDRVHELERDLRRAQKGSSAPSWRARAGRARRRLAATLRRS